MVLLLFVTSFGFSQTKGGLKLWYNTPSGSVWENTLPIGNGYLGAMIYGNVEKEVIQLNQHTVWSGSPNRKDNPLALDSLAFIRQLIKNVATYFEWSFFNISMGTNCSSSFHPLTETKRLMFFRDSSYSIISVIVSPGNTEK